jgi:hypothetical protein
MDLWRSCWRSAGCWALVVANWVVETVLPYWLLYHDRSAAPTDGVAAYFRHGVYPHCWHEEWAYRRG